MDILESVIGQTSYETEYMLERGKPMPSKNHAKLEARISRALLNQYLDVFDIQNEVSLELTSGKATPDVAIFPLSEDDWVNDEIRVKEPPLMVIEILSPTQGIAEIKDKIFDIYFPGGVKSAWILIPTVQTISVFTPDGKMKTYTSGIVKDDNIGLELDMASIFSRKG
jgi:Uma2 family endonuclease